MATWIIGGIVLVIVGAILWKMINDRRQGKSTFSGCSGNCQSCHSSCSSHPH